MSVSASVRILNSGFLTTMFNLSGDVSLCLCKNPEFRVFDYNV